MVVLKFFKWEEYPIIKLKGDRNNEEKNFGTIQCSNGLYVVDDCLWSKTGGTIRIGSKEFTEQFVLANMYELLLQDAGLDAEYIGGVGGTTENHDALINGEIDIYPEYTGTALLTILEGSFDSSMTGQDVYNAVKTGYEENYDLAVLDPTKFNNTYCLTMKKDMAEENGIKTIERPFCKSRGFCFWYNAGIHRT